MQIGQSKSTRTLQTRPEVELGRYGQEIRCRSISLYDDELLTPQQAAIEATKMAAIFNIRNDVKVTMMAEIMLEEGWTVKRAKDAVKHVLKSNIYNTAEKGLEPGVILEYDKRMKLYTQDEVMEINDGTGTHGFNLIQIPGMLRSIRDGVTDWWYVREGVEK